MTTTIDTLLSATKTLLSAAWKLFLVHVLCFLLLVWFESPFTFVAVFIGYVLGWAVVIYKTRQKKLLWFYLTFWLLFQLLPRIPLIMNSNLFPILLFFAVPFLLSAALNPNQILSFSSQASVIVLPLLSIVKLIYLTRKQREQPPQQGQDT